MGDMHALQGDGEIAGHTMDVAGTVTVQVQVLKKRKLEGPVLFPLPEDLPFLARPFDASEKEKARTLAKQWGVKDLAQVCQKFSRRADFGAKLACAAR
jgi:formamidase